MDISIELMPPCTIAFVRRIGPYGAENKNVMECLKKWAKDRNLLNNSATVLGIALDSPEKTQPELCRYDACLVVEEGFVLDSNFVNVRSLIGGKYCTFKIKHTAEAVREAWGILFSELIKNGFSFDETRTIMERYSVSMVNNHFCEICVPIR